MTKVQIFKYYVWKKSNGAALIVCCGSLDFGYFATYYILFVAKKEKKHKEYSEFLKKKMWQRSLADICEIRVAPDINIV